MTEATCKTCKWSKPLEQDIHWQRLECWRYPPVPIEIVTSAGHPFGQMRCSRPFMMPDDFCGEHTPKDEAND